jgi:cytochrome c oxidase assembly protein subunit 15
MAGRRRGCRARGAVPACCGAAAGRCSDLTLNQVPIDLALSHQAVAIVVLTIAVVNLERLSPRRVTALSEKLSPAVG